MLITNSRLKQSLVTLALLFSQLILNAQSYQSSFSDITVDSMKPGFGQADIYNVEPASGALNINIPLGQGIGTGGIHFTPTIYGRFAQQCPIINNNNPMSGTTTYYQSPTYLSVLPGHLDLKLHPYHQDASNTILSQYELWNGLSGSIGGPISGVDRTIDATSLIKKFGYATEQIAVMQPFGEGAAEAFVKYTSTGDIFIGISDPTTAPLVPFLVQAIWGDGSTFHTVYIPTKVLLVHGDIVYEFTTIYDESNGSTYRPPYDLYFNRYRLTSIRNKFLERIDIVYSGQANVMDYSAKWVKNNVITTLSVDTHYDGSQLMIKYTGNSDGPYVVDTKLTYPDLSQPFWAPWSGFSTDMFSASTMDIKWLVTAMYQQINSITNTATGQVTKFTYAPYGIGGGPKFNLPTSIAFPNGSRVDFAWQNLTFLHNDAQNGVWQGYFRVLFKWGGSSSNENWKSDCMWGITSVNRVDSDGQSRATLYKRVIPVPKDAYARNSWSNTDFYVDVENPDHSNILNIYWSPINNSDGGPAIGASPGSSLSDQYQTLAHLKHLLKEQRFYAPGVDWASDRIALPASSKAFKIIQYSDLDIRSGGIPVDPSGLITGTSIPIARTQTTTYLDRGVVETVQLQNWLGAPDYAWKNTQRTVSLNGAVVYQALSTRTYDSLPQFGIMSRQTSEIIKVMQDTTGGLSSAYPQITEITPHTFIGFDTLIPILNRSLKSSLVAGSMQINTNLFYISDSGFNADKLDHITVNSPDLSGTSGITSYTYDYYGRMESITPVGASWTVEQRLDWQGRPLRQIDANHFTSDFSWDGSGRLKTIDHSNGEVSTQLIYNSDQRGVTINTGNQTSINRYNGFGESILTSRVNPDGSYNHKILSYDSMGRKIKESVWLSGIGSDAEGKSYTGIGESFAYNDPQGRLTDHTDPNGTITNIQYLGLTKKVTKGYGSPDATTTTFSTDALGRLIKVTDALGQVTNYAYTPSGKIATVTQIDPGTSKSQTRTWTYNPFDWLTAITQPESGTTTYSDFTILGKPKTTTYTGDGTGSARILRTVYDALGRVTSNISDDNSVSQSFAYEEDWHGSAKNKLTTAVNNGVTRSLIYEGLNGRLSAYNYSLDGLTFPQSIQYDPTYGLPVGRTYPDGSSQALNYDWTRGLPTSSGFGSNPGTSNLVSNIIYDPNFWGLSQISYANGATSFFTNDTDQVRLHSITHSISNLLTKAWTYTYDQAGRLKNDSEDYYTYDALDRLKSVFARDPFDAYQGKGTIGLYQAFDFDAFGNRKALNSFPVTAWPVGATPPPAPTSGSTPKAQSYSLNASDSDMYGKNHLPATTTTNIPTGVAYDAQGNLTQVYGQPTSVSPSVLTMTYDALARVTKLGDTKNTSSQVFTYDDQGLRIKVQDTAPGGKATYYIYNEARQLVAVYELVKE